MKKIFLDTNVLYELIGLSLNKKVRHEELKTFIAETDAEICVTTAVISEILIHNRHDDDKLISILKFIGNARIKKIKSHYIAFPCDIDIFNLDNEQLIKSKMSNFKFVIDEIMWNKSTNETNLMILLFKIIAMYYASLYILNFESDGMRTK